MKGIPLSLRRKIVIVLDSEKLIPQDNKVQDEEKAETEFLYAVKLFKTTGKIKEWGANVQFEKVLIPVFST